MTMQVNEHGLECPISWDKVHSDHDWATVEYNGLVYSYEFEPHYNGRVWIPRSFNFEPQGVTTQPTDASKCLWKRPKPTDA